MPNAKQLKQNNCDHEFISNPKSLGYYLAGKGETVEKDIICKLCGLKAREIYIYSCIIDENDKTL